MKYSVKDKGLDETFWCSFRGADLLRFRQNQRVSRPSPAQEGGVIPRQVSPDYSTCTDRHSQSLPVHFHKRSRDQVQHCKTVVEVSHNQRITTERRDNVLHATLRINSLRHDVRVSSTNSNLRTETQTLFRHLAVLGTSWGRRKAAAQRYPPSVEPTQAVATRARTLSRSLSPRDTWKASRSSNQSQNCHRRKYSIHTAHDRWSDIMGAKLTRTTQTTKLSASRCAQLSSF